MAYTLLLKQGLIGSRWVRVDSGGTETATICPAAFQKGMAIPPARIAGFIQSLPLGETTAYLGHEEKKI